MTAEEFLSARLDEDERVARAATGERWQVWDYIEPEVVTVAPDGGEQAIAGSRWVRGPWVVRDGHRTRTGGGEEPIAPEDAAHIARHHPARALAEAAAKRAVLDAFASGDPEVYRTVVLRFASAYAHHPDFDPAWRS
ncbi:DUF6221 family protein [Nocardiopsis mangrovi]|uniref:DUF6221 family protein n=1 Tax=Nocardiopsis mangrovi TaxID=1179818 RepID=A0ABV9DWU3_9ACTN